MGLILVMATVVVIAIVAILKYYNSSQDMRVESLFKTIKELESNAPKIYTNLINSKKRSWNNISINDLIHPKSKHWHSERIVGEYSWYWYTEDIRAHKSIANIIMYNKRATNNNKIEIKVWCDKFSSTKSIEKCTKFTGLKADAVYSRNISW